jgi:hypothetical protein
MRRERGTERGKKTTKNRKEKKRTEEKRQREARKQGNRKKGKAMARKTETKRTWRSKRKQRSDKQKRVFKGFRKNHDAETRIKSKKETHEKDKENPTSPVWGTRRRTRQ